MGYMSSRVIRESETIIAHLWQRYGNKATAPVNYRLGRFMDGVSILFFLPSLLRLRVSHGMLRTPSRVPAKPLLLYGFEPSPFVKIVREALCCLELHYIMINCPHGRTEKRR